MSSINMIAIFLKPLLPTKIGTRQVSFFAFMALLQKQFSISREQKYGFEKLVLG